MSLLGPNFPRMRRLIIVLMSNGCYLAVILIFFLVVTGWLLFVTARYLVLTGGYCSLPLVTARSHFNMNELHGKIT